MEYFKHKYVCITGGSSGIGLEAACKLAACGAHVAIFGREEKRLQTARKKIEAAGISPEQSIYTLSMDISDHADVEMKIARTVQEFGVPNILINSAGMGHADYFEQVTYDIFDQVVRTNLYGTRNVIAALVPFMKTRGGHIVNVSSMIGLIGLFGYSTYGASKFALVGFSECLRMDLKRYNIHVSVFCPPEVDTPMTDLMLKTSPPESRALVKMTGLMRAEKAADALLKGIQKKNFLIIPGYMANNSYFYKRVFPALTRLVMDMVVARASRKIK